MYVYSRVYLYILIFEICVEVNKICVYIIQHHKFVSDYVTLVSFSLNVYVLIPTHYSVMLFTAYLFKSRNRLL